MLDPPPTRQTITGDDLQTLIATLPVGVYVCDATGRIRLWNRRATELWGREPDAADTGQRFCGSLRLFRPDGAPLAPAGTAMAGVLRTGESRTDEVVFEHPDRTRIAVRVRVSPLRDDHDRVTGAVAVLHESGPQDASGSALWLSEARYRAIVEDQPDLVCRFLPDGALTFANEAYCRYFGFRREDAIGKPYSPVVHPDDLAAVNALVGSLSPANPVVFIENRVRRADGAIRWTQWTNRAIYDDHGRLLELQSSGRDVNERKQVEEDAARLAAIVASADVAIISLTLDGTVTSWNRAAELMFGYSGAEAIGRPIGLISPADRAGEGLDILARLKRGETVTQFETERVARDGHRIPVSLTVSPIREASGRIIGISKIARDITERKRAEREAVERDAEARAAAEETSRLKDRFLAVVSHELRTPLNAMLGWAQMLRDGSVAGESVPKALDTILRNARMQAQLVEDLLDVSRIVSGKLELRVGPVLLAAVVHAAIEAVRPAAANRNIHLHVDLQDPETTISGDAGRLQQAIWNLLTNAVKFTPRGGRVDVELRRTGGEALITVRDTGGGIPADVLPFIFDRFRQADGRTTRAYGGLGLGLTIVKHFAEAHGGSVHAVSAGPGEGATFVLSLPIGAGAVSTAVPDAEVLRRPDLTHRHVLVVDDEPDTRDVLRAILERRGARVTTAASVTAALAEAHQLQPDVLVGDLGMPDRDGYDLIRAIRAVPGLQRIPAIALTAYATPQYREAALQAGYDAHLSKPIEPDAICRAIVDLCAAAS